MGVGIPKNTESLEDFILQKTQFHRKQADYKNKCINVWKIDHPKCQYIPWPYTFKSTSCYLFLIVSTPEIDAKQTLTKQETPIEIGQMLFSIQFLQKYLCQEHKVSIKENKKQYNYRISTYLYYGQNLTSQFSSIKVQQEKNEDNNKQILHSQSLLKSKAVYYFNRLNICIERIGLHLSISQLNLVNKQNKKQQQSQNKNVFLFSDNKTMSQCLEYVDLQLEHYQYLPKSQMVDKELYGSKLQKKKNGLNSLRSYYAKQDLRQIDEFQWVPIQIVQKGKMVNKNKRQNLDDSMPFACQITQIQTKKIPNRIQSNQLGNIDDTNVMLEQLGITHSIPERIQQFLKGLFLGTERVSRNYNLMNEKMVKLIINCAPEICRNWFLNDMDYQWIFIPNPLNPAQFSQVNIECLIYDTTDLIAKYSSKNHGVMLHCSDYDGQTKYGGCRSATILIGVIMVSLNITYEDAEKIVKKKWEISIPEHFKNQLLSLQKRRKAKPKGYRIFGICSYSAQSPDHLVAKYLFQVQQISNIQGFEKNSDYVFICLGQSPKILIGPKCQYRAEHQKKAKEYLKLLLKYELGGGSNNPITVELIEKTFRKQSKIISEEPLLLLNPSSSFFIKCKYSAGYMKNENLVFKYPILRPIWEKKKKQDGFYFTVKQKIILVKNKKGVSEEEISATIILKKGSKWIGFKQDEKKFLQKITQKYLYSVPDECIILQYEENEEDEKSLFDESVFGI